MGHKMMNNEEEEEEEEEEESKKWDEWGGRLKRTGFVMIGESSRRLLHVSMMRGQLVISCFIRPWNVQEIQFETFDSRIPETAK